MPTQKTVGPAVSLSAVTSGIGRIVPCRGHVETVTVAVRADGTVTGGTVVFEEAYTDPTGNYGGTWSALATVDLSTDLVPLLRLTDASGHGHTATFSTPVGITSGVPGALANGSTGLAIDGTTNTEATITSSLSMAAGDPFSVEFWLRPQPFPLGSHYGAVLINFSDGSGIDLTDDDTLGFGPGLRLVFIEPDPYGVTVSTTALTAGALYYCVLTSDGTTTHWYLNTVVDGTGVMDSLVPLVLNALFDDTFDERLPVSLIDEIAVYPSVLSASAMAAHYAARTNTAGAYASLVLASSPTAYWPLNDTIGSGMAISRSAGCFWDVRARVASPVTGGGTITATVIGA